MKITIHQPEHMPWLGLFHKISQADTLVFLDNVQYRRTYFQNRNKIRVMQGWQWILVPVKYKFGQEIKDVLIDNTTNRWKKKYLESIATAYKKTAFFERYFSVLKPIINKQWDYIAEMNEALTVAMLGFLGLKPKIIKASSLKAQGKASDLLLGICRELTAHTYISGISGKEYLKSDDFQNSGIKVVFQEFHHPVYKQLYEPFIPCMSAIDLVFNHGDKSLDIIKGIGVKVLEEVFH